jgi:hypothetical protein
MILRPAGWSMRRNFSGGRPQMGHLPAGPASSMRPQAGQR